MSREARNFVLWYLGVLWFFGAVVAGILGGDQGVGSSAFLLAAIAYVWPLPLMAIAYYLDVSHTPSSTEKERMQEAEFRREAENRKTARKARRSVK